MRVFTAIEIPTDVKSEIEKHITELRMERSDRNIRWVKTAKMHLTLRFLAEASPEDVGTLISAMDKVAETTEPFMINHEGTGAFPSAAKARVLWIGLGESKDLHSMKDRIDRRAADAGIPPESRLFRPHLTIARIRPPFGRSEIVREHLEKDFGPAAVEVSKIVLFESSLESTGPVYSVLHEAVLTG